MFNTIEALLNAIKHINAIGDDQIEKVILFSNPNFEERMYLNKQTKQVLGYATISYQGMRPGYGKVWTTNARLASCHKHKDVL